MSYPTATHGIWCNAKIKATRCAACKSTVVHFICDCGDRVLLDASNPIWQIHECRPHLNAFSERDLCRIEDPRFQQKNVAGSTAPLLNKARYVKDAKVAVVFGDGRTTYKTHDQIQGLEPVTLSFVFTSAQSGLPVPPRAG